MSSTLLIAMMLISSIISTSYAGTELTSEEGDVTLKIKSYLMTSMYVTIPSITFNYVGTTEGYFNGSKNIKEDGIPNLTNIGTQDGDIKYYKNCANGETVNGYQTYTMSSGNIIPAGSSFPHAGEYIYTVKESSKNNSDYDSMITYSSAQYKLHVFVVNDNGNLRVNNVYAEIIKKNDGTNGSGKAVLDGDQDKYVEGDFGFINYLLPLNEKLSISNSVTGDYANLSDEFDYALTIKNPTYVPSDETRKYYGLVVDETTMKPVTGTLIEFESDKETYFVLKNNEKLVFVKSDYTADKTVAVTDAAQSCMPGGIYYIATFCSATGYTATGTVTHGGITEKPQTGKADTYLELRSNTYVDIGDNKTDFSAGYRTVVPTGIDDVVAPFVFVIALSAIALTILFRRKEYDC